MTGATVKLLVVDDEPAIRALLIAGLGTQGYTLSGAGNGAQAIQQVATDAPELIILDLGLPDIPGEELLRRWRREGLETPIVILSSRTDEAGIVQALDL